MQKSDRSVDEEQNIGALLGRDHQRAGSLLPAVFLCRHGETVLNAGGRLRGLSDPELDAVGRQQAEALALTLQPMRPVAILASPLRRAVHTAEAIAAACGLTVEVSDGLLDRDYGPQNGHLVDEVDATWDSVDNAPGVEPWESVLARAQSALAKGTALAMNGPVVLVSHDACNRALLAFLDPERWPEPSAVPQPTGCLNVLHRDGGRWTVVSAGLRPAPPIRHVPRT
jgi:broad specificity phosphatase PhoE